MKKMHAGIIRTYNLKSGNKLEHIICLISGETFYLNRKEITREQFKNLLREDT